MELNTIKNNGSWSELAGLLNDNFAKINTQLLKYQDVDAIDGINFVGYVTSVDLLPTPKVASWAVVGADIKEVSVCAYYLEGSVPVNMTTGWNVLSSLGTYDFTDFSQALADIAEVLEKMTNIDVQISDLDTKITNEYTRATSAEKDLQANIEAEIIRAKKVEEGLQTSIETEATRAATAESKLQTSIDVETNRSKECEQSLQNKININKYGFNVTVNGIKGGVHTLSTAIQDVPASQRMSGQKITFDTGTGWVTYQFANLAISEYKKESEWKQISGIEQVSGDIHITNKADEEDLTSSAEGVLRLADKDYVPESFSGLGRKFLRKNIVIVTDENGENLEINQLTQDMLSWGSTRYIIQYDFDLNGAEITVPEGCVLDFKGGSFSNGFLRFNKTKIEGGAKIYCGVSGSVSNNSIIANWFMENNDITYLYSRGVFNLIGFEKIDFEKSEYTADTTVIKHLGLMIENNDIIIDGNGSTVTSIDGEHTNGTIFYITNSTNIRLRNFTLDGNVLNAADYAEGSRHNICIRDSYRVFIDNILSKNALTDGLYIIGGDYMFVNNYIGTHNGRMAGTIVSGENITFTNSIFEGSYGNPPKSGFDIEPNFVTDKINNIKFHNCIFNDNSSAGLTINLNNLASDNLQDVNVFVVNSLFKRNGLNLSLSSVSNTGRGYIDFVGCMFEDSKATNINIKGYSAINTPHIIINNSIIRNANLVNGADVREYKSLLACYNYYSSVDCPIGNLSIIDTEFIQGEDIKDNIVNAINFYPNIINGNNYGFKNIVIDNVVFKTNTTGRYNTDIRFPDVYTDCRFNINRELIFDKDTTVEEYLRSGQCSDRIIFSTDGSRDFAKLLKPEYYTKIKIIQGVASSIKNLVNTEIYSIKYRNGAIYEDGDLIFGSFEIMNTGGDYIITIYNGRVMKNNMQIYTSSVINSVYSTENIPKNSYNEIYFTTSTKKLFINYLTSDGVKTVDVNGFVSTFDKCRGNTASRPVVHQGFDWKGFMYFDTDLNKPIWSNGAGGWIDATGAIV